MLPCVHQYQTCAVPDYERCSLCGTYHSMASGAPSDIYASGYWDRRGHSTIRDQVYNVDTHEEGGRTKNRSVLQAIEVEDRIAALEIGCAPGILLRRLREDAGFHHVVGIEVDRAYESDIRDIGSHDGELLFGYFPKVTCGTKWGRGWKSRYDDWRFSLIVGLDIFEHAHDPAEFLTECARLLKPAGQLLLMLPLATADLPARFYEPCEHVFVHSVQHVRMMLDWAGFECVTFSRWTAGHEVVSARLA